MKKPTTDRVDRILNDEANLRKLNYICQEVGAEAAQKYFALDNDEWLELRERYENQFVNGIQNESLQ